MSFSKMASLSTFLMFAGTSAQDNFLFKKDSGRLLSEEHQAGTFAAARPGTCCTLEPHTKLAWSEFKTTASFLDGLHDGAIVVPCGHEVTVDESFGEDHPVGLQVLGSLKFQDGVDLRIVVSYVFVCGDFAIGSPESPHESDLEIILRTGESDFMWSASEMTGHLEAVAGDPALPSPHDDMHDDEDDSDDHNMMADDHDVDEIMPEIDDDEVEGHMTDDMPMTMKGHDMHPVMSGHVHSNFGKAPFVTYGGSMYINGAQCGKTSWTRLRRTVEPDVDPTINIARGRSATQSSYDSRHPTWSDSRGTDGNYHWKQGSVETRNELNPFWSLALDEEVNVQTVVLQIASLTDVRVVVSSDACEQGALCPGQACTYTREFRKSKRGDLQHYPFHEFDCAGATGSFVHLQIEGQAKIYFSEMEVYEAASDSIYELVLQPPAAGDEEPVEPAAPSTINIARGRSATQSSYNRRHPTWSDRKGTDGNYHWKKGSVETESELNPFWSLELDGPTNVQTVVVEDARGGQKLIDARVVVSSEACEQGELCPGQACTFQRSFRKEGGRNRGYWFEEFDCRGARGNKVHVQIEGQARLYFSEMEVFEATGIQSPPSVSWRVGDRIVIAPSGRNSGEYDHDLHIVAVEGNVVRVRGRMSYTHLGCDASEEDCVEAAEVASLSSNVRIRGSDDCGDSNNCGHFMIAHTNTGTVCGVSFSNLGQKEREGRYPLHLHLPGDSPDIVLKSNVLSFNRNRGIVLHGTNQALVDSNVVYNTNGHCIMLEDAIEQENRIVNNLAMDPQRQNFGCNHAHDGTFKCPDRTDNSPNAFWISNPNNYFEGNVGIAPGAAYFFATRHVFGLTRRKFSAELARSGLGNGKVKGRAKVLSFKNNMAHSSSMGMGNYPRLRHPDGSPVVYEHFTAWACGRAQEARGAKFEFHNSRLINNDAALVSGMVDVIKVYNSQLQGNGGSSTHKSSGYPLVSAPMVWKLLSLSTEAKIRNDFWIDDATKEWTLQNGGYDWDAMCEWPEGSVGVLFEECR